MFNLFKKKSEKDKLQEKYRKLMEEAHKLSHTNRKLADEKTRNPLSPLRSNIFRKRTVLFVRDHSAGERNGKETGILLSIVVQNAEGTKNGTRLV